MNPFTYRKSAHTVPYGQWRWEGPSSVINADGVLLEATDYWAQFFSSEELQRLSDEATNRSLENVKSLNSSLGVAVAEAGKTKDMLLDTARRIAAGRIAAKQGRWKDAFDILQKGSPGNRRVIPVDKGRIRALADDVLMVQYGVKPLLQDLYGAAEGLAAARERTLRTRVVSSKTLKHNAIVTAECQGVKGQHRVEKLAQVKFVYVFSVSPWGIDSLKAFGLTNPASILWELTPWSFAGDWVWNLGQYLDLWDATLGLNFEKGCKTVFQKSSVRTRFQGSGSYAGGHSTVVASGRSLKVDCARSTLGAFPSPTLPYVKNPFKGFDSQRTLNQLALFVQQIKK